MARSVYYAQYMNSPGWAAKRRLVLIRDGFQCQDCGQVLGPMHVHHMTYEHLGEEPLWDLITLCQDHHEERHCMWWRSSPLGGGGWDELGPATEWRLENWTDLRHDHIRYWVLGKMRCSGEILTDREAAFYAEDLYGRFGGDDREVADDLDRRAA